MIMNKSKFRRATNCGLSLLSAVFAVLLIANTAFAQSETGQITGKVTDPNGAVVTGAAVTLSSVETGAQRTATTNDEGVYTITNLQPGTYEVVV